MGLALTAAGVVAVHRNIEADARGIFNRHVERIEVDIQRRFKQPEYGLKGTRGAHVANHNFSRAGFRAYVASRDLAVEFPGVRGFGFSQRVARENLDRFIATERADDAPEFAVRTTGNAPDLYVVKYIEPLATNRPAWGFDIGSESVRRQAIEQAARTGETTLSGRLTLVQDGNKGTGFLLMVPVYLAGTMPSTPDDRLRNLSGLPYAPIVAEELLKGVIEGQNKAADFELFDGAETHKDNLVFDTDDHLGRGVGPVDESHYAGRMFNTLRPMKIGGRALKLRASSTPEFEASVQSAAPPMLAVAGGLLSVLMAFSVWLMLAGRARAVALAESLTADLDRLAKLAQRTSNAVCITDENRRITWVNEGFTRISGYSLAEAQGRLPTELLDSGKADPAVLCALEASAHSGTSCRVEVINRAKDGREYWFETEIQPLRNRQGTPSGFMEIGIDSTEKKRTSELLQAALREHNDLLRTIQMHAIVSVANPQGKIIDANGAFCVISDFTRDELLGAGPPHRQLGRASAPILVRHVDDRVQRTTLASRDLHPRQERLAVLGRQHHRAGHRRRWRHSKVHLDWQRHHGEQDHRRGVGAAASPAG